ncbi:MAG: LytR family transcriptional regulator, partial [Lachnospiraceae bacterium]|nr:LytR family transcriptional regulator [Lachnospiraceae bacterium]
EEIFSEAKNCNLVELNDLLNTILPNVITDIGEGEMLSLLLNFSTDYKDYEIQQARIPYDGTFTPMNVGGASVIGIDIQANIDYLHRDVYGEDTGTTEKN